MVSNLRVTPGMVVAQSIRAAQAHGTRLSLYQSQTSSGLKLTKPSDDPVGTRAIMGVRSSLARMDTELSNITTTRQRLEVSNTSLLDAQQILVKVKDLALQARQSVEPTERQAIVDELNGLRQQLIGIANTKYNGEYLFGGAANNVQPFTVDDFGNVTYVGSDVRGSSDIRPNTRIDVLYSGADVFQPQSRQTSQFVGSTGAQPGQGIDSASGYGQLQVIHTLTTYAPGSGIAAGASSAVGDTIIGPAGAHSLAIDDGAKTISLNGGPVVSYTGTETDLKVTGPSGEVVYVNVTGVTPGFAGSASITADGALSTDGGATQQAITFSANQQVQNSVTGDVTNVDTSAVRRAGTESIDYAGTADVFQVIAELETDLKDEAHIGTADWQNAMTNHMTDIERMQNNVLNVVGEQSVSLESLDSLETRINNMQVDQQKMASDIEGADMADAVLHMQQEQTMLQYTLAATARMFDISLVNYL